MVVNFVDYTDVYGSETCNKPAGLGDNQILVAFINTFGSPPIVPTTPVGWTQVIGTASNPDAIAVLWKYVTVASSEPANYTFTSGSTYTAIGIGCYSGADPADPWDTQSLSFPSDTNSEVTVERNGSMAIWGISTDIVLNNGNQPATFTYRGSGDGLLFSDKSINAGLSGTYTGSTGAGLVGFGIIKSALSNPIALAWFKI